MTSRPIASDPRDRVRHDDAMRPDTTRKATEAWFAGWTWPRRAPLAACILALVLTLPVCLACALLLDVRVARLAAVASPDLRRVAQLFSDFGLSGYMLVLSALIAATAYGLVRQGRFTASEAVLKLVGERAVFVFVAVALSGIVVQIVKHVVGRARPSLLDRYGAFHFDVFSLKASLASFPSGHSTSIFALAVALGLMAPRLRIPAFVFAMLVALARVVLSAHYASDTLAGAMLGIVMTVYVAHRLADRSIAFDHTPEGLHLKGAGTIMSALRARRLGVRAGA